jgi:hypothetical protein
MKIDLQRALVPEDFGREEPCAVCETPFRTESVIAYAKTDYGMSLADESKYTSAVCPECVEVLGAHRPDKFPTIEEYRTALRRYPEPVWASAAAAAAVEGTEAAEDAYRASLLE